MGQITNPMAGIPAGDIVDARKVGAKGDGTTDDTAALRRARDRGLWVYVPPGAYRTTDWIEVLSNQTWFGPGTIANDKTNANPERQACFLVGNHHPLNMATQTFYVLNAIALGDATVTLTTSGDAANLAVGQLVIVGSATNIGGVSRHAQLSKITAIAGAVLTLHTPIASAVADARVWTIGGTDAANGAPIAAVENVAFDGLGFTGRSAFATKGAVYGGRFDNLRMPDVAVGCALNMATHVLIRNWSGQYCGRYVEFAFNSFDVSAEHILLRFAPPAGLQAGETMVLPIHLGEQCHTIKLRDCPCLLDARYTVNGNLAQIKGSNILIEASHWRFAGSAGSTLLNIPDCAYTGFAYDGIEFDNCRFSAPAKATLGVIGGAAVAAENPVNVRFRGGELYDTVTAQSLWFQAGNGFEMLSPDKTGSKIKVSTTARDPLRPGARIRYGTAEGAITKHRIVKFGSADDKYGLSTLVSDRIAGVFLGPADAADGDAIAVMVLGECNLEVTGAIGRGMSLTTNASGQGANAAPAAGTNNKIVGHALISGTSTTIPVFVSPGWFQG